MWLVTYDRYGIAGVLAIVLLASLVRYRAAWARIRRTTND
jgi:hypothetical protein